MIDTTRRFDIVIVGAGILGVSLAFWLSEIYDATIALIEAGERPGMHASSRNTGVIHRPFYLDPKTRRIFARTAEKSFRFWSKLASSYSLPWRAVGTLEVATRESDLDTLEKYRKWSVLNGMGEVETVLLDSREVTNLEHEVRCRGALFSKNDVSVNFGEFTSTLAELSSKNGVKLLAGIRVKGMKERPSGVEIICKEGISCRLAINVAGGGALDIAHSSGLGREYSDLNFRGEYWQVDEPYASRVQRNVYTVARHGEFPFLDPHFVVRASGKREIGPNAVFVLGSEAYSGLSNGFGEAMGRIFQRPMMPKLHLFRNRRFLSLVSSEWRSSLSKKAMCDRVRRYIPSLSHKMLSQRGVAGVRSSLIDKNGFVPEALILRGENSVHILNYNSPGATGAPSYSAYLVSCLRNGGFLDGLKSKLKQEHDIWNFEVASNLEISEDGNLHDR